MLFYSRWLSLPINVRHTLATHFGITKSMPTHVQDNRVVVDGYRVEDVENTLTVIAMQNFAASDSTDMAELFELSVLKVSPEHSKLFVPTPIEIPAVVPQPVAVSMPEVQPVVAEQAEKIDVIKAPEPKKRGRKAKAN
jgi:hypothetical protein